VTGLAASSIRFLLRANRRGAAVSLGFAVASALIVLRFPMRVVPLAGLALLAAALLLAVSLWDTAKEGGERRVGLMSAEIALMLAAMILTNEAVFRYPFH
jgi:hypothetical protein